jgi:hypothetical protein
MPPARSPLARFALALTLAASVLTGTPGARADEYIDRVNAAFKQIPADKRSDTVLLPLLAAMDPAPDELATQARAALLASRGPGWAAASQWAQKPAQKAVLDALDKVTKEEDRLKAYAFAQPYGVDAMGGDKAAIDLISKGLYTELGEPALLSAARFGYMPALEQAGVLAHVEASRRLEAGDFAGAVKVLGDWVFFARQVADRPFIREKKWAIDAMTLGLERIRDLVFTDMRSGKRNAEPANVREAVTRLRERRGFLMLDRLTLPEGDFIAAEQMLSLVMTPGAGPNRDRFGPYMARTAAADRPLRLFSSSAYWDTAAAEHASERETRQMLSGVREDWSRRWQLPAFDPLVQRVTDYRRRVVTTPRFAMLSGPFADIDALFAQRQALRAELGGTRMALGVYGYLLRQRTLPPGLEACRPEFIDVIDKDPYGRPRPGTTVAPDLRFFVAARDTPKGPDGEEKPHVVRLFPDDLPSFEVPLGSDQFVVFSVGPDGASDLARQATQNRLVGQGDYLLFPPMLSLVRQRLIETDQLK